jgi:superfamily II DNA or RNA helicase
VIVPKEDILFQWVDAIQKTLGLTTEEIGIWRADQVPNLKHKAVVALIQSVMKGPERYGEDAYNGFGLLLVDEVHTVAATEFSQTMWHFPSKLRLGMSATPYRKDGKDKVFLWHIGEVLVEATTEMMIPKVLSQKTGWRTSIPHDFGNISLLLKPMAHNTPRNQIILKYLLAAYQKGRSTVVFSDSLVHLNILAEMCYMSVAQENVGFYVGTPNNAYLPAKLRRDQNEMRKQHSTRPILFATYAMAKVGTNLPWLDTCILTTPKADVTQIVGRIRREYEDKKEPVVIDLVDDSSHVLAAYARTREKWYASIGAPIVRYSA